MMRESLNDVCYKKIVKDTVDKVLSTTSGLGDQGVSSPTKPGLGGPRLERDPDMSSGDLG